MDQTEGTQRPQQSPRRLRASEARTKSAAAAAARSACAGAAAAAARTAQTKRATMLRRRGVRMQLRSYEKPSLECGWLELLVSRNPVATSSHDPTRAAASKP